MKITVIPRKLYFILYGMTEMDNNKRKQNFAFFCYLTVQATPLYILEKAIDFTLVFLSLKVGKTWDESNYRVCVQIHFKNLCKTLASLIVILDDKSSAKNLLGN